MPASAYKSNFDATSAWLEVRADFCRRVATVKRHRWHLYLKYGIRDGCKRIKLVNAIAKERNGGH